MGAIRILQVFTIMNRGGAESMIMNYYRNMDRNKVQFDFLVHRKQTAAFDEEITQLGGKIYKFDPINPILPESYYNKLRAFFKEHTEYKVVHSHLNTFSCFPLKIAKEFNIPCRIAHSHNALEEVRYQQLVSNEISLTEYIKTKIKYRLRNKIHDFTTHKFSCGDKAGKWLFGKDSDFKIMNNAIDAAAFAYDPECRDQYRKEFHLEKNFVLGHVGGFSKQKNHSFLLEIFKEFLLLNPEGRLVLIGEGPLYHSMVNKAKELKIYDQCVFTGVRSDIPKLVQMLDVFVFPSFFEGLPVTLIEAQSAGLPIVASDRITQAVNVTGDITFLPIEHPSRDWAKKILECKNFVRKNNYELIKEQQYDISENVRKIENFYIGKIKEFENDLTNTTI